jgi:hypothetical protein
VVEEVNRPAGIKKACTLMQASRIFVGVARFELTTSWSQTKRDTGLRYTPNIFGSANINEKFLISIPSPKIFIIFLNTLQIETVKGSKSPTFKGLHKQMPGEVLFYFLVDFFVNALTFSLSLLSLILNLTILVIKPSGKGSSIGN